MDDQVISEILERLAKHQAREAWEEFLRVYAGTILSVVRHFEREEDAVSDCFVYVCQQLVKNRFRKLRKFNVQGPARFSTWLRAVVRNLCLDWYRREFGRHRPFEIIRRAPTLDQQIFAKVYEEGVSPQQTLEALLPAFPTLNADAVLAGIQRVEKLLSGRQRWLLAVRQTQVLPLDDAWGELRSTLEVPDPAPGPEDGAITNEQVQRLREAVVQLPPADRVLLKLRFEQALTLEQIARMEGLASAQGADRRIREVVARLRLILGVATTKK